MAPTGKGTCKAEIANPADDDDRLNMQIRAAAKQAVQAKQQDPVSKGAKAKDGGTT